MPEDPAVIVVGAAVAGSAVANALGARGIPTLVVERGFERDNATRGDFLHPPTLRFLSLGAYWTACSAMAPSRSTTWPSATARSAAWRPTTFALKATAPPAARSPCPTTASRPS